MWAQQKQDEGRGHNIFSGKERIYSYGRHFKIAEFIRPDVVLINDASYSPSTSNHQRYVRGALHGLKITQIHVPVIANGKIKDDVQECCDRMMNVVEADMKRAIKAITKTQDWKDDAGAALARLEEYLKYVKGMTPKQWARLRSLKKTLTSDDFAKLVSIVKAETEATKKANAERKAAMAERARVEAMRYEERLAEWLAGGSASVNDYGNASRDAKTYLRIKGGKVQTSRGAEVPLDESKTALAMWKVGALRIGYKVGHFEVEEASADKIKIGRHHLLREEIERIAPQLEAA